MQNDAKQTFQVAFSGLKLIGFRKTGNELDGGEARFLKRCVHMFFKSSRDPLANVPEQPAREGRGPLFHRTYEVDFVAEGRSAEDLADELKRDSNRFSAQLMARFEKTSGEEGVLRTGDHFLIHITGPWNGPVEVVEVTPTSFTFATLQGHLEAGRIRFSVEPLRGGAKMRFRIESWARSGGRLIDFLYDKLPLVRAAQTEMWDLYCRAFAETFESDPSMRSEVQIRTRRLAAATE